MACPTDSTLAQRFWKKVNKNGPVPKHCPELGPCWIWTAYTDEHGRGQITTSKGIRHAHKVSWILDDREIPEGMCLLHRCDNMGCPNPDHLYLGTQLENIADMIAKGRNPFGERHWSICGARPRSRNPLPSFEKRFWLKVNKDGPVVSLELGHCWVWTGSTNQCGYGLFGIGGSGHTMVAHKVHWKLIARRELPDGMKLLHKCDNPPCVRLDHLFAGTHADNMKDMEQKGRANHPSGAQHYRDKLSLEQVLEIRRLADNGMAHKALAVQFNRRPNTISKIVNGRLWR